jgi:surface polysaccharide O-acyltransferase-like enzyme
MASNPPQRTFWLEGIKALAIVMVVVLHVSSVGTYGPRDSQNWWLCNICNSITRPGVPLFLMISGALLLDGSKYSGIGDFYRRRFNRLVLPLFGWSLFYLYHTGGLSIAALKTPQVLLVKILSGPTYYHLGFLYYLIGLYLIVPILHRFVASARNADYIYYLSAWFLFESVLPEVRYWTAFSTSFAPTFLLNYSGYLVAGHYFANYLPNQISWKTSYSWALAGLLIAVNTFTIFGMGATNTPSHGRDFHYYEYPSFNVVISSVCIFVLMRESLFRRSFAAPFHKAICYLSSCAFGIYLVHPFLLEKLLIPATIAKCTLKSSFLIPLLSAALIALSMLCVWVSSKIPLFRRFWGETASPRKRVMQPERQEPSVIPFAPHFGSRVVTKNRRAA